MHTAGHITEDGFHLKRVFEADVDVNSLAEHPAVGGHGQVGHPGVEGPAPGGWCLGPGAMENDVVCHGPK